MEHQVLMEDRQSPATLLSFPALFSALRESCGNLLCSLMENAVTVSSGKPCTKKINRSQVG